jgi:hypothetical protein
MRVVADDGRWREFHESVRLYSEPEMRAMFSDSGFANVQSYGALVGTPFGRDSQRLIMVASKREA